MWEGATACPSAPPKSSRFSKQRVPRPPSGGSWEGRDLPLPVQAAVCVSGVGGTSPEEGKAGGLRAQKRLLAGMWAADQWLCPAFRILLRLGKFCKAKCVPLPHPTPLSCRWFGHPIPSSGVSEREEERTGGGGTEAPPPSPLLTSG